MAAAKLDGEASGQTLQPTALVHEAYLRLVRPGAAHSEAMAESSEANWDNRGHFFAAAAQAMRRILVERARAKGREKRGGKRQRLDVDDVALATKVTPDQLLAIDDALAKLALDDPIASQIVMLRYFTGLSVDEAGKRLGLATATAYRHWNYARVWLHSELMDTRGE